jgi:hypothetical protein
MDATALHLDGNALGTVLTEAFLGRTRLSLLLLNSSALTSISNRTFLGLRALKRLHLEHNRLVDLSAPLLFPDSPGLEELYLHHNRLQVLGRDALAGLNRLRILTLHNNQLTSLAGGLGSSQLPALRTLTCGKNPWTCSCELALTLSRLGQRSHLEQITCRRADTATGDAMAAVEPVLHYSQSSCRELDVLPVSLPSAALPSWLVLAICSLVGGAATLLVAFLILLAQRQKITRWIHARKACPANRGVGEKEAVAEDSSQYSPMLKVTTVTAAIGSPTRLTASSPTMADRPPVAKCGVYLHYCLADDEYVRELLAPRLAARCQVKNLRLCLHHSDLRPAATVGEAISEAVRLSDCLLILASSAYFLSSVALYELQLILSAVVPRQQQQLPSFSVIVVVPPQGGGGGRSQARSQLAALAGSGAQNWTYLAAEDPLFYDRLSAVLQRQQMGTDSIGGGGGNPSLSSSSAASSCSTRSTGAGSQGLPRAPQPALKLPLPRIIPNPLDDYGDLEKSNAGWEEAVYSTVMDPTGAVEEEDDVSYQTVYTDQYRLPPRHGATTSRPLRPGGGAAGYSFRTLQ